MTTEQEAEFLAPFINDARQGRVLVVKDIHCALEEHLGHRVALVAAYNLFHRHSWRKLVPDKRNVAADIQAQEEWEKTAGTTCPNQERMGKAGVTQIDVSG
ncbi:MAG: winged helix-turn-helix domain-containing protein [Deferribacteraceae bacterium]|jgi:hypothetical protein|nr:winged helix-turn-helix domain-containing protein [Deferribacteraceae bacterium]